MFVFIYLFIYLFTTLVKVYIQKGCINIIIKTENQSYLLARCDKTIYSSLAGSASLTGSASLAGSASFGASVSWETSVD